MSSYLPGETRRQVPDKCPNRHMPTMVGIIPLGNDHDYRHVDDGHHDDGHEPSFDANYRRAVLIFSSIPAPGHNSFSPSRLNGVS
jgi:hypothetical protein